MHFFRLFLGILSVWRVTHLLHAEDGPEEMFVKLRSRAGEGFWGQVLDCFYCLSVWVAAPFAIYLGQKLDERILFLPAFSAGAILLERATDSEIGEAPTLFIEEYEDENVLR